MEKYLDKKAPSQEGPPSYANWVAFNNKYPLRGISEYPLYTDAQITGEIIDHFGPYKFLNTIPMQSGPGVLQPSIVLRSELYLNNDIPQMNETDTSNYHGGWFADEIAALVSLCMGIRVKAADESRRFNVHGDPLGRPRAFSFRNEPSLTLEARRLKLPSAIGSHALDKLDPIKILPYLAKDEVVAVIKAARLYQDAIWIAESEPALSWVMFVSALEAGANEWHKVSDSPLSKLKATKPVLHKILEETGIDNLSEIVAMHIVHSLGATSKFVKFTLAHLPEPPEKRPREWAQIKWSRTTMKKILGKIYEYRSNALHGGTPFPAPMCQAEHEIEGVMAEKPIGLASHTQGGTWVAEDTPILLHMFEYIVRGALLNWLKSLRTD